MILVCSRGHEFDLSNYEVRSYYPHFRAGCRCPWVMEHDNLKGNVYCEKTLHTKGEDHDVESPVEAV